MVRKIKVRRILAEVLFLFIVFYFFYTSTYPHYFMTADDPLNPVTEYSGKPILVCGESESEIMVRRYFFQNCAVYNLPPSHIGPYIQNVNIFLYRVSVNSTFLALCMLGIVFVWDIYDYKRKKGLIYYFKQKFNTISL